MDNPDQTESVTDSLGSACQFNGGGHLAFEEL